VSGPFVSAAALYAELRSSTPPVVLDASFVLHSPTFDGDYRRESAYPRWLEQHLPGSRYVEVPTQFSDTNAATHYAHPEPQAIADELARLGIAADRRVVVYDSTGAIWAARLWYLLDWIGVDVRVLDGGIAAWVAAGYAVESGPVSDAAPVDPWPATSRRNAWVTREELLDRSSSDDRPLVCGLPAPSFTGTAPTRYSRRGRIPGSVNVSSRALFSKDGTVLDRDTIEQAYADAGVAADAPEILLYCGGGISASANALTLAAVGAAPVRIYDGSLEEWSADPSLPLDLG
jgi:thiosulfate/3-mercaptopyruvate sulfurtransferase